MEDGWKIVEKGEGGNKEGGIRRVPQKEGQSGEGISGEV